MRKVRAVLVATIVGALLLGGSGLRAVADIDNASGTNVQEGDNRGNSRQGGRSASGDAVGGQVTGVVSSGRTSVDARNVSRDSSVESGEASGTNSSRSFVGLASNPETDIVVGAADLSFISLDDAGNLQEGDNRQTVSQTASATTGDAVAGEVIGVVTGAGGSASVVAANTTTNSDAQTGDSDVANDSAAFVGLANAEDFLRIGEAFTEDISFVATGGEANIQEGDNRQSARQSASAASGDGVVGQVVGVVSSGATSVDTTNRTDDAVAQTGDADAANEAGAFVGLAHADDEDITVTPADVSNVFGDEETNLQEGDNRQAASQSASASTGDAVAGAVIGAVTSAGGSTSIVAANTSRTVDTTTGDADAVNEAAAFVGLGQADQDFEVGPADIDSVTVEEELNVQEGDNRQSLAQAARAATGDGVAGQVVGAVSAGATSIDAANLSEDVVAETGDADAVNDASAAVGLAQAEDDDIQIGGAGAADIDGIFVTDELNVQEGDNRQRLGQTASATSGDAVGGGVIGAVTAAGGSASIVAANTSRNAEASTGDADAANRADAFVGLALADDEIEIPAADISNVVNDEEANVQEGDNRQSHSQTATATTGDGVAGQVLGVVSAGATSVDATNRSEDVVAETGDADAANESAAFVGLAISDGGDIDIGAADIDDIAVSDDANVQEGDNARSFSQTASASSGDAVAGQVLAGVTAGIITGAGGSVSAVVANTSTGINSSTGDAEFDNSDAAFVGLATSDGSLDVLG